MTEDTLVKGRPSIIHISLAVLACLLWSTAFAGIKIGLHYIKPFSFAGLRFILAGLLLLPFCGKWSAFVRIVTTHFRTILLVSLFQTFLLYGFFYTGIALIPGALGAIVIGAAPLFSAITAHFYMPDDEMTWGKSGSIAVIHASGRVSMPTSPCGAANCPPRDAFTAATPPVWSA